MDSVIQLAARLDSFGELNTTSETLCSILDISFSLGSMDLAKGLSKFNLDSARSSQFVEDR